MEHECLQLVKKKLLFNSCLIINIILIIIIIISQLSVVYQIEIGKDMSIDQRIDIRWAAFGIYSEIRLASLPKLASSTNVCCQRRRTPQQYTRQLTLKRPNEERRGHSDKITIKQKDTE